MKIGIIGTIVKDQIYSADATEINSIGGIFYTLSILGNLAAKDDQIYPVCYLGQDIYDEILSRLSQYQSIRFDGVKKIAQNNTAVKLIYQNAEQRNEFLSNRFPPLQLEDIGKIGSMDVWLVNFITGFELSLETFQQFCEQTPGLIFMDFHSLSLDIAENGLRVLRKLPNWEEWIRGVDVLQMNEAEAISLSRNQSATKHSLIQFGNEVINKNIKIFHITRGSKGSLLFYRNGAESINFEIPPRPVANVVDVTGCGDAFAAGFLQHYFHSKDIVAATHYANSIAGINCTIRGTEELFKLSCLKNQR
ncbi:MAG: carbohydrate kinase family protein [bacterium]|jgi:sugar/nucleoside kinase (ribokinase family)|nr:carbohydrate kinase family protein [bacterium]